MLPKVLLSILPIINYHFGVATFNKLKTMYTFKEKKNRFFFYHLHQWTQYIISYSSSAGEIWLQAYLLRLELPPNFFHIYFRPSPIHSP